ncbi:MAG: hypothetical protein GY861_13670 [bacterium]|nr:hypothetical protein [bacterium]
MEKRNSSEVIEPKTVVRKRVRFEVAEAGSSSAGFGVGRGFSRTTAERYRHLHNYVFEQTKPNRNASKEEAKEYRYLMQIKREVVCFSESTSGGVDVYNDLSASKWSAEQKKQLSRIIGGTEVTDPYLCNGEAHKRVTESLITESGLVQKVRLLLTEDEVESVIKQMLTGGVHGGLRQILGKLRNNYSGIDMSMVCFFYLCYLRYSFPSCFLK